MQRNNRAASNAAIATANAASTAANAAGATVAVVTKKKEMVLSRPNKGIGDITVEECLEMQRACGYGGPHVQPKLEKVRFLCRVWETQAVEARVRGAGMNTPLMTAIKYGHQEVALELIDAKWDRYDQTVGEYMGDVMKKIMKKPIDEPERPDNRANIFSRGIFRWMPLHYAAREAQPEVVKAILARIPNAEARREHINATDKKMRTPLWLAIFNNTNDTECRELCAWYKRALEVIDILVENGAEILKALKCKHVEDEFKERIFMEFQSTTQTMDDGEISNKPERFFYRMLVNLAAKHKQHEAQDKLVQMLFDENNPEAAKKPPRNNKG